MSFSNYVKKGEYKTQAVREMEGEQYTSLNDAAWTNDGLAEGNVEIWFAKPEHFRLFIFGYKEVAAEGKLPATESELSDTHTKLGSIKETDLDNIYMALQGEGWSPNGEARNLIRGLSLGHTTMSVGDIVVKDGVMHMVDNFGFKQIDAADNGVQEDGEEFDDAELNGDDLAGDEEFVDAGEPEELPVENPEPEAEAEEEDEGPATDLEGMTQEVTDELYDIIDTLDKARKSLREVKKRVEDDLKGNPNRVAALEEYKTFYEVFSTIQDKNLHRMIELLKAE